VATGSNQDERMFTGYSQFPQQKKCAFFDMDRKWLKERGKAKVKGWQTVQQPSVSSPKVFSLKELPQPMTLTTQPTVAP
jgi:hypothetical protein